MAGKLKQGEALFAEGKIEEAEKYFLNLLEEDPTNAEILNNLGAVYYSRENFDKAEDFFLKAFKANDNYLDALLNLADLYQNTNCWEEAANHLEKYTSIDGQDPNLFNQLGMVYLEMGDAEKARAALAESLELNPNHNGGRCLLVNLSRFSHQSFRQSTFWRGGMAGKIFGLHKEIVFLYKRRFK